MDPSKAAPGTTWNLKNSRAAKQPWVVVGVVTCCAIASVPLMFKEVRGPGCFGFAHPIRLPPL
jgi:hypothetical protein